MTKQQYRAAKALIADEQHWVRGISRVTDAYAGVQYCAIGACEAVGGDYRTLAEIEKAAFEISDGCYYSPASVNDSYDHATVLAMFDRAIELAPDEAS